MINNYPLVSILVPCYNHEDFIKDTLNSIKEDSYINKEICIIDDGSTDNSTSIISNWVLTNKQSIEISFISRENKGICTTLNELVKMAKGEYLIPCASDDTLFGNTISTRIKIMQDNPRIKVLVSDALVIDSNNNIIMNSSIEDYNKGNKTLLKTHEGIIKSVLLKPCISGATIVIKKDIYNLIGKYPDKLKAEDWWFFQRAAAKHLIMFYDCKVSCYRIHNGNISGQSSNYNNVLASAIIYTYFRNFWWFENRYKLTIIKQIFRYVWLKVNLKLCQ